MANLRYFTVRIEKSETDYTYEKVVAANISIAIDWALKKVDGTIDQVTYVSSEPVALAE